MRYQHCFCAKDGPEDATCSKCMPAWNAVVACVHARCKQLEPCPRRYAGTRPDPDQHPAADVAHAFVAFVDSFASARPPLAGVKVLFVPAFEGAMVPDAASVRHLLRAPRIRGLRVAPSKAGKSAWVAARIELARRTLHASAFLVLDGKTWRVVVADLSAPVPNRVASPSCGNPSDQWKVPHRVPRRLAPTVRALLEAIDKPSAFVAMMSSDKDSLVFGSAPGERFVGGAAIKKVFRRWRISSDLTGSHVPDDKLPAVAGIGPDGEQMWVITPISGPVRLCTEYRGFFVLAKQAGGWKIVHQHYSSSFFGKL